MKVLIVGSGGREHALAWALSRSPRVNELFIAPGNGGTAGLGANVDIAADDVDGLSAFATERGIDLTVVGPEAPLVAGIADRFASLGLKCYGPSADAARLEGSKVFAKQFMGRHDIPTAAFEVFDDADAARAYVSAGDGSVVVKADGLAAGKGVYVTSSKAEALSAIDDIMVASRFGTAGARVVIEQRLEGEEVSVHAICAGGRALLLPSSQDHKRAHDGDTGPNTGGMGAYAPVPSFGERELAKVHDTIIAPTLAGLAAEGIDYAGTLYAGLMLTPDGPRVLEYNVRFGDPETQVLLPLVRSDLFELLYAASGGALPEELDTWSGRGAATVVMAANGYPGGYEKGFAITGLENASDDHAVAFHAGTKQIDGGFVTSGGRVLAVTAWNDSIKGAVTRAYDSVSRISFEGAFWRHDIAGRALARTNTKE